MAGRHQILNRLIDLAIHQHQRVGYNHEPMGDLIGFIRRRCERQKAQQNCQNPGTQLTVGCVSCANTGISERLQEWRTRRDSNARPLASEANTLSS